jgi:hypothetical protein
MNFTERLQAMLDWVASHGKRLSREGVEGVRAPDYLAGARVYFYCATDRGYLEPLATYADERLTVEHTHPIILGARGQLTAPVNQVWLKPGSKYRVQIHDSDGAILFTEDDIAT